MLPRGLCRAVMTQFSPAVLGYLHARAVGAARLARSAVRKGTWAHRHEATGPEMTAWQRAASFLDGGVFCGCIRRP